MSKKIEAWEAEDGKTFFSQYDADKYELLNALEKATGLESKALNTMIQNIGASESLTDKLVNFFEEHGKVLLDRKGDG